MFLKILKKDIKVRKSINIILFLFIMIASVFLSSSVSNIVIISSSIDYYMDYANQPDIIMIASKDDEKNEIIQWLDSKDDEKNEIIQWLDSKGSIKKYDYEELLILSEKDIEINNKSKKKEFISDGISLFIGKQECDYCKVYDMDGNKFTVEEGEIAFGKSMMEKNNLNIGDKITITLGDVTKTFTIKLNIKDAIYGHEMSGMHRMIVNENDYEELYNQENLGIFGEYYIETDNVQNCVEDIGNKNFETVNNVQTSDTYDLIYSMDMIVAALLILIGICLILIAFLVLRFALIFTIEEDYREIGIMKAIGMKDFSIKKIYLTKYLFLVITGALTGLLLSVPVSTVMVQSVSQNMIMESSSSKLWINVLCTVGIIVIVMLFCYNCTRKLNKISAIAAICGGKSGERYGRLKGVSLYKRAKMPVILYLGVNDITSNIKRYMILLLTFCISFILITIPANTLNTMRSREMIGKFDINPESSILVKNISTEGEAFSVTGVEDGISQLKDKLEDKGYDAKITYCPIYFMRFGEKDSSSKISIMTIQMLGDNTDFMEYDEGDAPKLENEVAFSKQILKMYDWKIGDTVTVFMNGEEKDLIITGTYSDYMQLGQSARLNPLIKCSKDNIFDYWATMIDLDTDKTQEELKAEFDKEFPEYEWSTAQELVDVNVGGIQNTLDKMLYPMTGLLCLLIMLITMLMEKLFIVREKGEIAMLKSIGYKIKDIRMWQILRMLLVAVFSMIFAVPLSFLSNRFILRPIFAIMGAEVNIQVDVLSVYFIFPAVLFAGIIIAAIFATRSIKKISIREMNKAD